MIQTMQETERKGKLSLGSAPYTYARISAMRGKLIHIEQYHRLMKMKLSDILRFLQETEYKKEMDEMAVSYKGVELVEFALNKNLVKTFQKLKKIAEYEDLRLVMEQYMKRKDIWNIKTILRGKMVKEKEESLRDMLMPIGELTERFLEGLLKKDSVEDIIRSLSFLGKENMNKALELFKETKGLYAVENLLDRIYFERAMEFSKRIPSQGSQFKEFLETEIDAVNIKTLLRLKRQGMKKEDISGYLIFSGARIKKSDLLRLAKTDDIDRLISLLNKLGYSKVLGDSYDKTKKDISNVELRINKNLLDRTALLLHQHPLSLDVILGYMFAKEIEVRNIRTIVKGKQLDLKDEFIENELVIGR